MATGIGDSGFGFSAISRGSLEPAAEGIHFRVSGLSRREPGSGVQVRVQVQDLNVAPYPHLTLIART
jgi:hypothetical protein